MSGDLPRSDSSTARKALPIVLLTLFLDLLGFSILFPIFAEMMLYYQNRGDPLLLWSMGHLRSILPDVSDERLAAFFGGIVLGVYAILQFFTAPLWGRLSDRIGRRPVLLITTLGNLLGYLIWCVSGWFAILLMGRVINGIAAGNLSTLTAAAADCSTAAKRTRVMGAVGATFGAGFLFGPAIGGLAYSILPSMDGYGMGLNAFSSIALLAAALTAVNFLIIWRWFTETLPPHERGESEQAIIPIAVSRGVRPLHLAYFIFMVGFTVMELAIVFMVKDLLGFGPTQTAWLFVAIGTTSIVIQGGVVRRMAHRIRDVVFVAVGLLISIIGLGLLASVALWPVGFLAFTGAIIVAMGSALVMPGMSSWVSKLAPAHVQGAALGRLRSLGALARVVGPFGCAILYFSLGASAPFTVAAILTCIPVILVIWYVPRPRDESQEVLTPAPAVGDIP